MSDKAIEGFLWRQHEDGLALARASDLLELEPFDPAPARRYLARFHSKGLVQSFSGEVEEASYFELGVHFAYDYLRRADPFSVVRWFRPRNAFHPNINGYLGLICIGKLKPGTTLVDILYQCFDIITYKKVTMREDDALNQVACGWARDNQHRFPIDPRPLKRRALVLDVRAEEQTS